MHGQPPPNPLSAAARETLAVAREAKSPLFERVALITMVTSAAVTTAIGGMQAWHMLKRDLDDRHRDQERERRSDAASPPPERPGHGGTATAGMPSHGRDDDRRWTRREEYTEAAAHHGRQR